MFPSLKTFPQNWSIDKNFVIFIKNFRLVSYPFMFILITETKKLIITPTFKHFIVNFEFPISKLSSNSKNFISKAFNIVLKIYCNKISRPKLFMTTTILTKFPPKYEHNFTNQVSQIGSFTLSWNSFTIIEHFHPVYYNTRVEWNVAAAFICALAEKKVLRGMALLHSRASPEKT